ncbi:hypothetical protein FZEAL_1092 [Fusarium zealandicum]|uniref:Uncharacterized protein n=1 Tax=Fusarium zealandicum TaxID=1053134 RepID=A0A8H4UU87_9HYPO|nr:hypothetical protein FZEAL_1092 [Fusarium zealandicum]
MTALEHKSSAPNLSLSSASSSQRLVLASSSGPLALNEVQALRLAGRQALAESDTDHAPADQALKCLANPGRHGQHFFESRTLTEQKRWILLQAPIYQSRHCLALDLSIAVEPIIRRRLIEAFGTQTLNRLWHQTMAPAIFPHAKRGSSVSGSVEA